LLHRRWQALLQAGLAALDPRIDETGTDVAVQWRLVAVLDHQGDIVAAGGGNQRRAVRGGVAYFQCVLQRYTVQLLRQLCHQCVQRFGIGRMAWIELPQQRTEPVAERERRLQERGGGLHRAGQVAALHQVAWCLHRETEVRRRLRRPLRTLGRRGRAVEGAVDLDAAQRTAGMRKFFALRKPVRIERAAAPFGEYPATDAAADGRVPGSGRHWPWSARHGS